MLKPSIICTSRVSHVNSHFPPGFFPIFMSYNYLVNNIAIIPCVCDHSYEDYCCQWFNHILLISKEVKNLYQWILIRCWQMDIYNE